MSTNAAAASISRDTIGSPPRNLRKYCQEDNGQGDAIQVFCEVFRLLHNDEANECCQRRETQGHEATSKTLGHSRPNAGITIPVPMRVSRSCPMIAGTGTAFVAAFPRYVEVVVINIGMVRKAARHDTAVIATVARSRTPFPSATPTIWLVYTCHRPVRRQELPFGSQGVCWRTGGQAAGRMIRVYASMTCAIDAVRQAWRTGTHLADCPCFTGTPPKCQTHR